MVVFTYYIPVTLGNAFILENVCPLTSLSVNREAWKERGDVALNVKYRHSPNHFKHHGAVSVLKTAVI